MTLAEIKELDCDVITPAQAAGVLKCDPHFIRLGELAPASKGRGRTAPGHKKHMYCIKCRDITEHIQIE